MKPLNQKERTNLFFRFIGLYIVSIVFILLAIYFNLDVPKKENDVLRKQVITKQREIDSLSKIFQTQNDFNSNAAQVYNLLSRMNSGEDLVSSKPNFDAATYNMSKDYANADSILRKDLNYKLILDSYNLIWITKDKLFKDDANLNDCTNQLNQANNKIQNLILNNGTAGGTNK